MDERDWTEPPYDYILELNLNKTQASILYLLIKRGIITYQIDKETLEQLLKDEKESTKDKEKESLEITELILKTAKELEKEVQSIIFELENTYESAEQKTIISPEEFKRGPKKSS